ncbi:MAG TPA: tRNA (adenosine(37)-N6)-dimethylallyltransferase MiaA [Melioribacteraceae bacterium]|nr:tRNA (adenosine(37)-N6)-dimethylallyltransferase MiaA [Melioribacteraceae bacterium]
MTDYNLIVILGPTATGKTALATKLAYKLNGEIISADSRQVYKYMDLGTGKDLQDYYINGYVIPYYMIDIIEPDKEFDLFYFNKLFTDYYNTIVGKNKVPFLVGGSFLYLDSIINNYELVKADFNSSESEELKKYEINELKEQLTKLKGNFHNTTDLEDRERIIKAIIIEKAKNMGQLLKKPYINPLIIGIILPNEIIKKRINKRLKERLESGMVGEVENLMKKGITIEKLLFFGLEYKYIGLYVTGKLNYNDMYQKLNSAIYEFARKQIKWFRRMEKNGVEINKIEGADYEKALDIINKKFMQK